MLHASWPTPSTARGQFAAFCSSPLSICQRLGRSHRKQSRSQRLGGSGVADLYEVGVVKEEEDGRQWRALGDARMRGKGVSVVAWQAQSRGSVADEAAHPFHYPLRHLSLPLIVQ